MIELINFPLKNLNGNVNQTEVKSKSFTIISQHSNKELGN